MTDISIWAYPWDLHDIGPDQATARITDAGANMVSLAASYHAGHFVQPGNPRRRVYFPQGGTIYYRPDPARWHGAEIQPLTADIVATEGDMLTEMIRRRDRGGLAVSAWSVLLHNTRLGMLHPAHVTRTAHGDPNFYALCPSSPAVRDYACRLVQEIAETFAPNRIEIESPDFMGFAHGFHHEKDGLPLSPQDTFLLGLCFCPHCLTAAHAAGIPTAAARHQTATLLDGAFAAELPRPDPDLPAELQAFIAWRSTPVTALMAELHTNVRAPTQLLLIDAEGTAQTGINLPALIPHLDGILHCAYRTPQDRITPLMAETRALLGPQKTLIAGFQLFHPATKDRADLGARVAATLPHADGANYYCLGLVPPARLDWINTTPRHNRVTQA
ncbi:MAG: hypothetical protein H7317_03535 [Pseudorhodobacter sp.]|nr:hypothetical protein [Pseudorhodobacter sp.]